MAAMPIGVFYVRDIYRVLILINILAFLVVGVNPGAALARDDSVKGRTLSYADVADMVTLSDLVIVARIKKLKGVRSESGKATEKEKRYLLANARVDSLIRGDKGVPPIVDFLAVQNDGTDGSPFRLRKGEKVIIFARNGSKPGEVQLVSRYSVMPMTEELDIMSRAIATEAARVGAPPRILSVGDAFHIAGTIAGEGETQIFLKTETGAPVSLSIIHRPGQPARWGVSLGEIIDDTAVPPKRNTLLWYRLACGLPDSLPYAATADLAPSDAKAAARDYGFVLESLGSCGRTL